jgi:outer membrane protein
MGIVKAATFGFDEQTGRARWPRAWMIALGALTLVAMCALATASAQSADGATMKVGYVDSQYLMSLHPLFPQIQELNQRAQDELGALSAQVNELAQLAGTRELTPEEQELLNIRVVTLDALRTRYDSELTELAQPAIDEVTAAVAKAAQSLGIEMVFDYQRAHDTGLIVYAAPETDITSVAAGFLQGE